jgi:hypothetical protein
MEDAGARVGSDIDSAASRRLVHRGGVITAWCWILLGATTAMAQQSADTVTETVTTRRNLNGRDAVSEKVVTHRARTDDEEQVVIDVQDWTLEFERVTK